MIESTIPVGMRYGEMPDSMLMKKFEYTDDVDESELLDDHAKLTLTDRRPDSILFPSDEAYRSASYAKLDLMHGGHRGKADDPAHPESFHDFIGEEWHDKRAPDNVPNMREMAEQSKSRSRLHFMQSDTANHMQITSGTLNEQDQMRAVRAAQFGGIGRMHVFSNQRDCRRNGKQILHVLRSDVGKTEFGNGALKSLEGVVDPEHTGSMGANAAARLHNNANTKWYAEQMQSIAPTLYNMTYRGSVAKHRGGLSKNSVSTTAYSESKDALSRRGVATILKNIAKNVRGEAEFGKESATISRASAAAKFSRLLDAVRDDAKWGAENGAITQKAAIMQAKRAQTVDQRDKTVERAVYILRGKAPETKRSNNIITPVEYGVSHETSVAKTAERKVGKAPTVVVLEADGDKSKVYKMAVLKNKGAATTHHNGEDFKTESRGGIALKSAANVYSNSFGLAQDQSKFYDNLTKDRHAAPLGQKSKVRRYQVDTANEVLVD